MRGPDREKYQGQFAGRIIIKRINGKSITETRNEKANVQVIYAAYMQLRSKLNQIEYVAILDIAT